MKTNEGGAAFGAIGKERSKLLAMIMVMALMIVGVSIVVSNGSDDVDAVVYEMPEPVGGVITLTEQVTLQTGYTVPEGVEEINLNGQRITTSTTLEGYAIKIPSGSDVLIRNGTIQTIGDGILAYGDLTLGNDLKITITGAEVVAVTALGSELTVDGAEIDNRSGFGIVIGNSDRDNTIDSIPSKLVFNSGSVECRYFTVSTNNLYSAGCTIDINGGTFESTDSDCPAIYLPAMCEVTIDNATITGASGIEMKMGDLTIGSGTTINATGEYKPDYVPAPGGAGANGSAINIGAHQYGSDEGQAIDVTNLHVTIQDGAVLNSVNANSVDVFNMGLNDTDVLDVDIDIEASVDGVRIVNNPSIENIYEVPVTIADAEKVYFDGSADVEVSGDDVTISGTPGDDASLTIKSQSDDTPINITWKDFDDNGKTVNFVDSNGEPADPSIVAAQTYSGNVSLGDLSITTTNPSGISYTYDGTAKSPPVIEATVENERISTSGFLMVAEPEATGAFQVGDQWYYWTTGVSQATIWSGTEIIDSAVDAGTYTVRFGYAIGGTVNVVECSWTIDRATLTISADINKEYDGTELVAGYDALVAEGLADGDSLIGGTISTTGSMAKTYTTEGSGWTLKGLATANGIDNYVVEYGSISLQITKRELTIAVDADKVYDGEVFEYDASGATITGLVDGESVSGTLTTSGSDAAIYDEVGSGSEVVSTVTVSSGRVNYNITYQVSLEITKKALTITGATIAEKAYDGTTDATVTGVTFDGLIGEDSLTLGTDYTASGAFDAADAGNDRSVTISVSSNDTDAIKNYSLPIEPFTITGQTISKATITITGASVPGKVYDGTGTWDVDSVTFGGTAGDEPLVMGTDFTVSTEPTYNYNAGDAPTYTKYADVIVTLAENLNYTFEGGELVATLEKVSTSISPIELDEDMIKITKTDAENGISVTVSVESNGLSTDLITVTLSGSDSNTVSGNNPFTITKSGLYTASVSINGDRNWAGTNVTTSFEVNLNAVNYYTKSTINGEYELEQTDAGSSVRTPNATNIPDGYILAGWSTTENGAKEYGVDVNIDVPASGLDLYAVYEVDDGTVVGPGTGSLSDMIVDAIHYPYEGGYDYTGIFNIVNGNVIVTYDYETGEFIKDLIQSGQVPEKVPEELVPMMNDLARFLGALHYYAPSVVDSITYGGTIYTWNAGEPNTASNWYNGSTSLVSAIVAAALTSDGSMELILTDGTYQYAFTYGVQFEDAPAPEVQYHDVTIEGEGVAIYIDGLRYFPGTYSMAEGEHTIGVEVLSGYTGTPVISNVTDGKFTVSGEMTIAISGVTAVVDPDPEKELPGIEFDMPVFTAGQDDAFRVTFIANDYVGETVTVKAKFSGDSSDITSIRYWNVNNNSWDTMVAEADGYYVYGGSGFQLSDATSAFRATFANAGVYTLTVYISIGGAEITSATETFIVEEPAVVSEYTVSFVIDENVGVTIDPMTVASGVGINLPVVSVEGYTFSGWMIQGGNSSIIYNGYYVPNSNVVFEAVISEDDTSFEPVYYNVILGSTTYSKLADSPVGLPSMIDGREITGWSTTSGTYTGVYYVNPADAVEGTITLTPIYADEEETYDIRVNLTGAGASESSYGTPVRDGNNFYLTVYTPIGYQIEDFTAKIGETVLGMSPVTSIDRHTVTFLIGVTSNGDVEVDISIEPNNVSDNITVSMEAAMDSSENEGVYIELDSNSDVAYLPVDATLTITYYYSYVDDSDSSLHIGVRSTDAITVENSGESISQALFIDLGLGSNYENPADADQFAEGNAYWIVAEYRYGESTVISNTVSPAYVES